MHNPLNNMNSWCTKAAHLQGRVQLATALQEPAVQICLHLVCEDRSLIEMLQAAQKTGIPVERSAAG